MSLSNTLSRLFLVERLTKPKLYIKGVNTLTGWRAHPKSNRIASWLSSTPFLIRRMSPMKIYLENKITGAAIAKEVKD